MSDTMEINLGRGRFRIVSDGDRNLIMQERVKVVPRKGGEPRYEYKDVAYFVKLEHACEWLLDKAVVRSGAKTFEELRLDILAAKTEIIEAMRSASEKEAV